MQNILVNNLLDQHMNRLLHIFNYILAVFDVDYPIIRICDCVYRVVSSAILFHLLFAIIRFCLLFVENLENMHLYNDLMSL